MLSVLIFDFGLFVLSRTNRRRQEIASYTWEFYRSSGLWPIEAILLCAKDIEPYE